MEKELIINEKMEMKKDFFKELRVWFKSEWYRRFKSMTIEEVIQNLQFKKMRQLYELQKLMTDEEVIQFKDDIFQRLSNVRNEMLFHKILYYSIRFRTKMKFDFSGVEILYVETSPNEFDVYQGKQKYQMNKANLDLYIKDLKKKDLWIAVEQAKLKGGIK